jgi:hypothetical protein
VSNYPGLLDIQVEYRIGELRREVENDRLADQIARSGRPFRVRLAESLRAAARRIEGQPQLARA